MTQTAVTTMTFDQARAEEAARVADQLAHAQKRLDKLEAERNEAATLISTLTMRHKSTSNPLTTQDRIKLAFATLRKKGYQAKMTMDDDRAWEGSTCFLGLDTFWLNGEPTRTDPNGRFDAHVGQLAIYHHGTTEQIQGALAALHHFGVVATWSGKEFDTITVEPRILTCPQCNGRSYYYTRDLPGGEQRMDCVACDRTGLVPNPAGIPKVA